MATKTRSKNFGSTKKITDFDPLNFELNGKTFNCKAALQGGALLEFVADADSDQGGKAASALYGFFEKALVPEDYVRFQEMLTDDDTIVDLNLLGEIAGWLVEEYTARPTSEPKS